MRRFAMMLAGSMFLIAGASIGLFAQSEAAEQGTLIEDQITSPSLEGNLLGDPATRNMYVYLPPSYDASPGKRYPTVYLLHGFMSGYHTFVWSMNAFFEPLGIDLGLNIQSIADSLLALGEIDEMIVVMPDAGTAYGGAWYANSPVNGNHQDYIVQDLVGYIDGTYRTVTTRDSRGIAGQSMGGHGALSLAMTHPEVFGAVAALSPGSSNDFDIPPTPIDLFVAENPDTLGEPIVMDMNKSTLELFPVAGEIFASNFNTNVLYSMASAFSPNPDNPPYYVDLPIEYPGKTVVPDIWEKWVEQDLTRKIAREGANLTNTPIFIDEGVGPVVLMPEVVNVDRILAALDAVGLSYTYDTFDGDHLTHQRYQVASALKFLSKHLTKSEPLSVVPSTWGQLKAKFR